MVCLREWWIPDESMIEFAQWIAEHISVKDLNIILQGPGAGFDILPIYKKDSLKNQLTAEKLVCEIMKMTYNWGQNNKYIIEDFGLDLIEKVYSYGLMGDEIRDPEQSRNFRCSGDIDIIRFLLDKGFPTEEAHFSFGSNFDRDTFNIMLGYGVSADVFLGYYVTDINDEDLEYILQSGANPNSTTKIHWRDIRSTPLMSILYDTELNHLGKIEILLKHGADKNLQVGRDIPEEYVLNKIVEYNEHQKTRPNFIRTIEYYEEIQKLFDKY